jgi:tetratricopeptide (TPR) repeat protein
MAGIKKVSKQQGLKAAEKIKPWMEDKVKTARKVSEHRAARAIGRFGAPAGVALMIILSLIPLFSPKTDFQKIKEKLIKKPTDFEAHLRLAEKFLENNQFEEAERALLLAQNRQQATDDREPKNKVLGEEANTKLEELWARKHSSDPKDIQRLIAAWEKILEEKPDYRDGWLQLTVLHYQLYEDEKAKESLEKALELDPNYEVTKELEKIINN